MNKLLPILILLLLALPARADNLPEHPIPEEHPLPLRNWVCVAADRIGHRFSGRASFAASARSMAMRNCLQGRLPSLRRCRLIGCIRR